jgi:transcriptional regulator with XRE-family HTH domain
MEKKFSGEILKQIRLQKGLTQIELGKRAGLSTRMIVHYEKHIKRPPANKLAALAKALNVSIEEFFTEKPEIPMSKDDKLFARKLEKAKKLPPEEQQVIAAIIDKFIKNKPKSK